MEAVKNVDSERYVDIACDFFDMAQECGNDSLRNYSSCILGDALFRNNEFSQAVYYLSSGIQGIINSDEYDLICRCFNEMGIIMRSEGHFISSEENYLNCIDIARAHRIYCQEAAGCVNFASLCEEMGAKNEALEYNYRAVECCQFIDNPETKNMLLDKAYAHISKLYVRQGDLEYAKKILDLMDEIDSKTLDGDTNFDAMITRWYYYNAVKEGELAKKYKQECIDAFYEVKDVVLLFDEIEAIVRLLMAQKEYKELEKIFERVEIKAEEDEVINIRLRMEKWKIKMYEAIDDKPKIAQSAYNYYRYDSKRSNDNRKSFITTLRLKTELLQQKTKNLFLSAQAETDTLTGLANRMKLNNVIDELFTMASAKGVNLGVEMMDVDFFKHVNDTYGHAKGDELLANMGQGFREIFDGLENIFVARYGGDEFIVYYFDMSDEEILDAAAEIKEMVLKVGHDIGIGDVTVSQGIVNHVPDHLNRAWDYLNAADYALYHVKENGKANVRLIHGRRDI